MRVSRTGDGTAANPYRPDIPTGLAYRVIGDYGADGYTVEVDRADTVTLDVTTFGANGLTDDTAAFQKALDIARTAGGGVLTAPPASTFRIWDTLDWPLGVRWQGGQGRSGQPSSYPRLQWYGPAGIPVIRQQAIADPSNSHVFGFERLTINCKHPVNGDLASVGIELTNRADHGTELRHVSIHSPADYGVVFAKGGINFLADTVRFDQCGKYGVRWVLNAYDTCRWINTTTDNYSTGAGFFFMDGAAAQNNSRLHVLFDSAKIETNTAMPAGEGVFRFDVNPSDSTKVEVDATFLGVHDAPASGVSGHPGVKVSPSTKYVRMVLIDSSLGAVEGVDGYSLPSRSRRHVLTVIAPHGLTGAGPESERSCVDVHGDVLARSGVVCPSPDGTLYRLVPPDGGGPASWVTV